MIIGGRDFDVRSRTYIMGILNATPDSFSDGGLFLSVDEALFHAEQMIRDGADIIDIGGESTRPGAVAVSAETEWSRVEPILRAVRREFDIPLSIDTYKPQTACWAIEEGIDLINDVTGLCDDAMCAVVAKSNLPCVIMHNGRRLSNDAPGCRPSNDVSGQRPLNDAPQNDGMQYARDVADDLRKIAEHAINNGVGRDKIIVDIGLGFGKDTRECLSLVKYADVFAALPYPYLVGHSRKRFIGDVCDAPFDDRLGGTLAVTAYVAQRGASFVRVHDVFENKRIVDMIYNVKESD